MKPAWLAADGRAARIVPRSSLVSAVFRLRHFLLLSAGVSLGSLGGADEPPGARPPVTTVEAAFALWPELQADDQPVELEGVVTNAMPKGSFRLHDGHLSLFVGKGAVAPGVAPGDRVRVWGVLRQGGFSPWIRPTKIAHLGRAPLPAVAPPASFGLLASGAVDNQWVEIEGVVRAVRNSDPHDFAVLDLGMEGGSLHVLMPYASGDAYASLLDAVVRLRGVAAVTVNAHSQLLEPSFRVSSLAEIEILRAGNPDPFGRPLVPVNRLLRVSPGVRERRQRVHTAGVVTRQLSATTVYVRDGDMGLKVETMAPVSFRPGEQIELAGYATMADGIAVLECAQARRMAVAAPPKPFTPEDPSRLIAGQYHSDLVQVRARLVDWVRADSDVTLVFQATDHLFKGLLKLPATAPLALPEKNSLVDATGICVIGEVKDMWFYQPLSFALLVADPADIALVEAPPWWTPERLWRALALVGAVLLAAAGWAWALRRQVVRTRAVIEHQARRAAVLEERGRIARDLHDTLEQGLTGLSLQMKAIETDLANGVRTAADRLQTARQMLRESRTLARNAIRELRSDGEAVREDNFETALGRLAENWNRSGLSVQIRLGDGRPEMPAPIRMHLLGIATEAVTNAVKHGRAGVVCIEAESTARRIRLSIADDGIGFDVAAQRAKPGRGFGLQGMRERVQELGGELRLESEPGRGTQVVVHVPLAHEPSAGGRAPVHAASAAGIFASSRSSS